MLKNLMVGEQVKFLIIYELICGINIKIKLQKLDVNKLIFGNKVLDFIVKCREFKCRANFTVV